MTSKSKGQRKPPRAREYTGPNTLEDVKKFWESDATEKAKIQAAEALPEEDMVKLVQWAMGRSLTAIESYRKRMDAKLKRLGLLD